MIERSAGRNKTLCGSFCNIKAIHKKMYGIFYVSDNIVFLIRNVKLFLWNTLDRIIDPLLTAIISVYQTLLLTKDLISFS